MMKRSLASFLTLLVVALVAIAQTPSAPSQLIIVSSQGGGSSGGGGGEEGTANIWIDDDGGNCVDNASATAYVDADACASMDAANDIADNGDTIIMKGGTYGAQSISGGNSRTSLATLTVASGETVNLTGAISFSGAEYIKIDGGGDRFGENARLITGCCAGSGGASGGVRQTENQYALNISGSEFVEIHGSDFGGWHITDSRSAVVKWNDIGPCHNVDGTGTDSGSSGCDNGSVEYCEVTELDCEGYNTGHLVEGNYIHDFGCDQNFFNGSGSDDCHWECMYVSYADSLTVRGNIFRNCANGGNIFHTFSNGGGSFTADFGYRNYLIENNVFEQSCNNSSAPCGGRTSEGSGFGHCNIYGGTDFTNVQVRFNTFLGTATFGMDNDCSSAGVGSVRFTGNIRGSGSTSCAAAWTTGPKPTFEYEIYYSAGSACGGTGNEHLGAGSNINGIVTNGSNGGDATILNNGNTALEHVPAASCAATHDIEGTTRPQVTDCDAGADEL